MDLPNNPVLRLRAQIASLEGVLADLKTQLIDAEAYYNQSASAKADSSGHLQIQTFSSSPFQPLNHHEKTFESLIDQLDLSQEDNWGRSGKLTLQEHTRYGRQLIMPEIGLRGGPSSLKQYSVRLPLMPIENRTTTIQKCSGSDRRCGRSWMSGRYISRRCRGGNDRPHGR